MASREEFEIWKLSPVTQQLILKIKEEMQEVMFRWAEGQYTSESVDGTVQTNAKYLGVVQTLDGMVETIEEGTFVDLDGD